MRLPDAPVPGLVLSYAYVWADQAKSGREEGIKARPAAIVLTRRVASGSDLVYVLPVTHSPPTAESQKVLIPRAVKQRLGMDDAPSWVDVTEFNAFAWPGFDLYPVSGRSAGPDAPCFYGFLPTELFAEIKEALDRNHRERRVRAVKRSG